MRALYIEKSLEARTTEVAIAAQEEFAVRAFPSFPFPLFLFSFFFPFYVAVFLFVC